MVQGKARAPSVMVDAASSTFSLGHDAVDLLQVAAWLSKSCGVLRTCSVTMLCCKPALHGTQLRVCAWLTVPSHWALKHCNRCAVQLAASQAAVPPPRDAKHGEPLGRASQVRPAESKLSCLA